MLKICRSPLVRFSAVSLLGLSSAMPAIADPTGSSPSSLHLAGGHKHKFGLIGPAVISPAITTAPDALSNIDHIIVIYQENWTFDGLYGSFPGTNNLSQGQHALR